MTLELGTKLLILLMSLWLVASHALKSGAQTLPCFFPWQVSGLSPTL